MTIYIVYADDETTAVASFHNLEDAEAFINKQENPDTYRIGAMKVR